MYELLFTTLQSHSYVAVIVVVETLAVFAAMGFSTVYLLIRARKLKRIAFLTNQASEELVEILISGQPPTLSGGHVLKDRLIYQKSILAQLEILAGAERHLLVSYYIHLGFADDDCMALRSKSPWERLDALVRLDRIASDQFRAFFLHALQDKHPLVVLAGAKALSKVSLPSDVVVILQSISRAGGRRRDTVAEIVSLLIERGEVTAICEYTLQSSDLYIVTICTRALGEQRALESLPTLLLLLDRYKQTGSVDLLEAVLESMRLIADPSIVSVVEPLTKHPDAAVRAKAFTILAEYVDERESLLISAESDSSSDVRRVVHQLIARAKA